MSSNWSQPFFYNTTLMTTSNATGFGTVYWPNAVPVQQLPRVLASPSVSLGDRAWLDAQIAEVCELAEAA